MNDLINTSSITTMSSLEIAELTGKRHDHVMRDAKKMLIELGVGLPKFGGTYLNAQNKEQPIFNLDKEMSLTLVSGYSLKLRHNIIKRWQELEGEGNKELTAIERAEKHAELAIEHVRILKANILLEADNKELEITLDKEGQWSSIKKQEARTGRSFNWRALTEAHNALGIERKNVFDQNYGSVKSYCAEAWLMAYKIEL